MWIACMTTVLAWDSWRGFEATESTPAFAGHTHQGQSCLLFAVAEAASKEVPATKESVNGVERTNLGRAFSDQHRSRGSRAEFSGVCPALPRCPLRRRRPDHHHGYA